MVTDFTYRDLNQDGKLDANEALKEVGIDGNMPGFNVPFNGRSMAATMLVRQKGASLGNTMLMVRRRACRAARWVALMVDSL